jgi:hypothetical protein
MTTWFVPRRSTVFVSGTLPWLTRIGSSGNGEAERAFGARRISNSRAFSGTKIKSVLELPAATTWSDSVLSWTSSKAVGSVQSLERAEMMNDPGATTSGLKRPKVPSRPGPTLPRLENEVT